MLFGSPNHPPLPTKDLISWIFDDPTYDPDVPVYIDAANPTHSLSYNQSKTLIRKLCAGFKKLNLPEQSCILVNAFNSIEYPILFLGIVAAGHIMAGANPAYTTTELVHHIKITSASFIISEPDLLSKTEAAAKETGIPSSNILILDAFDSNNPVYDSGYPSWTSLLTHGESPWQRFNNLQKCKSRTVCRLTSSGTTGLPKATKWSHYNLIAEHEFVFATLHPPAQQKSHQIRQLAPLPMFHAAIVPRAFTSVLKAGWPFHVMRRFDLESYLRNIERFAITDLYAVPPITVGVAMSPLTNTKYSIRSLRSGLSGAAPLSKELQADMMRLMHPDATFTQVWGMTETTCIVSCVAWPEDDRSGSIGRLLPGVEMKLVDDDGRDVTAYNVPGEACLRGPVVIDGYVGPGSEVANAASYDADGFFHTGDILSVREDGLMFIVDRKKELIKVRGFQVAPAELEGVLLTHPRVVDAAVIGVPAANVRDGEAPRAYIIRRPGADLTEGEVREFMAGKLAGYKRLDGGVRFVDVIPKNPSGKILKRILREEVKRELKDGGLKL